MEEKNEKRAPWIVRNAWWIAMFLAVWMLRVCSDLSGGY